MNKRFLSILTAAAMAAVVGCGGTGSDGAGDASSLSVSVADTSTHVVLTVAARGGTHADVINAVKGSFEESHNCTIEVLGMEADELKEKVIGDAENEYGSFDLVMIDDPLMPLYMESGVLYNLTAAGYKDDPDFVEKSIALGKDPYALGPTYALPFTGNVQLLFYNSGLLTGDVDLDSWEGVLRAAKQVQSDGEKGYLIRGQAGNPIVSDFLPILWAYGGDIFDSNENVIINSPENADALRMYLELMDTGANYEKDAIVSAVSGGTAAFALGWPSWFINGDGMTAEYNPIPSQTSPASVKVATGEIGNWMMGVTANSTKADLATELLIYLTSEEVQRQALASGGVPTRTSIFTDDSVRSKYPYFDTIWQGTVNSRVRPRTVKWAEIEEAFGKELAECVAGRKSVEDTLSDAQKAVEKIMGG